MKNVRLSTKLILAILIVNTFCISLLYLIASRSMTSIMKHSEMKNLQATLNAQMNMIEEYIIHQEDLLIAFSRASAVIDLLKDPHNEQKRIAAQEQLVEHLKKYKKGLLDILLEDNNADANWCTNHNRFLFYNMLKKS